MQNYRGQGGGVKATLMTGRSASLACKDGIGLDL